MSEQQVEARGRRLPVVSLALTSTLVFGVTALDVTDAWAAPAVGAGVAIPPPWFCSPTPHPTITVSDGAAGESTGKVSVRVTLKSCASATVKWATVNDTARAGNDYTGGSGVMTLGGPHNSALNLVFLLKKDFPNCEGKERFFVQLSHPVGATIADGLGIVTIKDCLPEG